MRMRQTDIRQMAMRRADIHSSHIIRPGKTDRLIRSPRIRSNISRHTKTDLFRLPLIKMLLIPPAHLQKKTTIPIVFPKICPSAG